MLLRLALLLMFLAPLASADDFDSGDIAPGATWSATFDDEGTFAYHCHPHPWMKGSITVGPAAASPTTHDVHIIEGDAGDTATWVFEPASLAIAAGDTVRWTNDGTLVHTATGESGGHDHMGGDHMHDMDGDEGSPGLGLLLVLGAVAALALARRK